MSGFRLSQCRSSCSRSADPVDNGNLGAVTAAFSLHREACLDALLFDSTAGKLRKPILSFVHLLRVNTHWQLISIFTFQYFE